jgi:hypothetical protein
VEVRALAAAAQQIQPAPFFLDPALNLAFDVGFGLQAQRGA